VTVNISGTAFTTTAPSTVGPLAAGASTTVDVGVTIPAGAVNGAMSEATVTFTSQGNGTASDSSVLTTISAWLKFYLPIVMQGG
jgi:hypothetical protein